MAFYEGSTTVCTGSLVGDVPNAGNCQVGYLRPFIVGLMYILVAFESFPILDKSVVMRGNVRSPGPCD